MEKEHVVCDTDVLIDYWDNASARHSNISVLQSRAWQAAPLTTF
jgi:hypothetical protein